MRFQYEQAVPAGIADRAGGSPSLFPQWGRPGRVLTGMVDVIDHLNAVILVADVMVVFLSVVCRYFLRNPINWAEEIASALMGMLVFLGSGPVLARHRHSGLEAIRKKLSPALEPWLAHMSRWIVAVVAIGLLFAAVHLASTSYGEITPLGLPQWIFSYPPIVGGTFLLVVAIAQAVPGSTMKVWGSLALVLAPVVLVILWNEALPGHEIPLSVLMILSTLVSLSIGVPIAFALAFGALLYFSANPFLDSSIYAQQMIAGSGNFVLLAIPFFILAGLAMEVNGMSIRLVELLLRMMGRAKGGMNVIIVIASAIFSGVSGSKNADIAAVGAVVMPAVRRTRLDPEDAAALLATTAIMSETIPPCINIIIFGFVANVSIGGLFVAGLIPALVLTFSMIGVAIYFGKRINPDDAFEVRKPLPQLIGGGLVGLIMIFMIGRGVMAGVATSTEISAFAVVYAFVVGGVAFRELTVASTVKLLVQSASTTSTVLFIVAGASALAFSLTIEQIPQGMSQMLVTFGEQYGSLCFLLATAVMMIFFGSVLEGAPALIIFGPLLTPVAAALGVDPFHFGMIAVVSLGFGLSIPPLGVLLYTTCAVTQTNIKDVSPKMIKYVAVMAIALLLLIVVPGFSLWLPRMLGY